MRTFEILPLHGVGSVRFGLPREAVRAELGKDFGAFRKSPTSRHETDAFDTLGIHVHYTGKSPVVGFIELMHEDGSAFCLDGRDVFRTTAPELVEFLAKRSGHHTELGSVIFPKLQVGLYRSHPFDPEFEEFDRWEAFGIGSEGYFKTKTKGEKLRRQGKCPL